MTDNKFEKYDKLLNEILGDSQPADEKLKNNNETIENDADISIISEELSDKASDSVSEVFPEQKNDFGGKTIHITEGSGSTNLFSFKDKLESSQNYSSYTEYEQSVRKKRGRKKNYTVYAGIILATLVVCISIVLSITVITVGRDVLGIESYDSVFTIDIPDGSTTADIADQLYDEGVIYYKSIFIALAKIKGADGNMYPGDIEVSYNMSYADIIDSLMEMREARDTVTVTFPEGITLLRAAQLLEENGVCEADDFIYTFNSSVFGYEFERYVSSSSLKLYKYEGYLFPDTYEFYLDDTAYNVVKKIKQRTDEILNAEVIQRSVDIGMTLDEVVTLASLVQLEASNVDDMKNIASVFLNRLHDPENYPILQSDTTYSYIDDVIKNVLTVQYQEMYDAYDTYTCTGLPVGAICNPGLDAINAVLYPNETNYYYFCSNIETGETYYATTYEEHLENCEAAGLDV